jgi:hypothetical protein
MDILVKKLLLILFLASLAGADTHTAASASMADVRTAIGLAVTRDTVLVTGNATWTDSVSIRKKITVLGSACTLSTTSTMAQGFFKITGFKADTLVRLSGFVFNLKNDYTSNTAIYVHSMTGSYAGKKIRIDHNTINFGYQGLSYYHIAGVIDNNIFLNCRKGMDCGAYNRDDADSSWNEMGMGTDRAIFIENNIFRHNANYPVTYNQESVGSENGGKVVIRYNTFDYDSIPDGVDGMYCVMTHGNADASCNLPAVGYWQFDQEGDRCIRRGQPCVEMYENVAHGKSITFLFFVRGSANLIYNNAITGTVSNNPRIYLREEEYESDGAWAASIPRTSWPAEDQVHNTFIWNNTYRGHDFNDGVYGSVEAGASAESGILEDRDYFLHAPQATGGYEYFTDRNGAAGSNPTDGSPYANYGTMAFSASGANAYYGYVAYTYPHPLRNEAKLCSIRIGRK